MRDLTPLSPLRLFVVKLCTLLFFFFQKTHNLNRRYLEGREKKTFLLVDSHQKSTCVENSFDVGILFENLSRYSETQKFSHLRDMQACKANKVGVPHSSFCVFSLKMSISIDNCQMSPIILKITN